MYVIGFYELIWIGSSILLDLVIYNKIYSFINSI